MSLEDKILAIRKLDAILEEREREIVKGLKQDPMSIFEPTTPEQCRYGDGQILFFQGKAKEKVLFGGNRSGKTYCAAMMTAFHITGRYPDYVPEEARILPNETRRRQIRGRIFTVSYERGVAEIIWPKLMEVLPSEFRVSPKVSTNGSILGALFPNGASVSFLTYRQPVTELSGWTGDFVWMDEPPPSREFYVEAIRGVIDKGGFVYVSATPLGCDWFDAYLLDSGTNDPNERYKVMSVRIDVRDNPFLPPEEVDWWVRRLPASEFRARVQGMPSSMASRVFMPFVRPKDHFIKPFPLPFRDGGTPDGWNLVMSLDPHDAHPAAMLWWAVWDPELSAGKSRIVQVAESWNPRTMTIQGAIEEIAEVEKNLGAPAVFRVIDPNFGLKKSTVTGKTVMEEYVLQSRRMGYPLTFVPGDDKISYGHFKVRSLLEGRLPDGSPQFTIFNSCQATIQSLMRYRFKDQATGKVENNRYKHFPDCLRYLATARFHFQRPKTSLGAGEILLREMEEMRKQPASVRLTVEERIRLNMRGT